MKGLGKFDWASLEEESNTTWILDSIAAQKVEDVSREDLLKVDKYLTYNIPKYGQSKGFITVYEITDRILDKNNNLFLITKSQNIDIE